MQHPQERSGKANYILLKISFKIINCFPTSTLPHWPLSELPYCLNNNGEPLLRRKTPRDPTGPPREQNNSGVHPGGGGSSSGELGTGEGMSALSGPPDKIISWERKWLPLGPESQHSWESEAVSPRRQLVLGSRCRSGGKPKRIRENYLRRKKCTLSRSKYTPSV